MKSTFAEVYYDLLVIAGALVAMGGIAMLSIPTAMIFGGVVIMVAGLIGAMERARSRARGGSNAASH